MIFNLFGLGKNREPKLSYNQVMMFFTVLTAVLVVAIIMSVVVYSKLVHVEKRLEVKEAQIQRLLQQEDKQKKN